MADDVEQGPSPTGHCALSDLTLYTRTRWGLKRAGLLTTEQICATTPRELLKITNFGKVSLADLTRALVERGLTLPQPVHSCPFCRCEKHG